MAKITYSLHYQQTHDQTSYFQQSVTWTFMNEIPSVFNDSIIL